MIAKTQFLKTDFTYRNILLIEIFGDKSWISFWFTKKMFQTGEGGIGINVSALKKTVSVVILRENFYSNKHIYIFAINLFHLYKVTP